MSVWYSDNTNGVPAIASSRYIVGILFDHGGEDFNQDRNDGYEGRRQNAHHDEIMLACGPASRTDAPQPKERHVAAATASFGEPRLLGHGNMRRSDSVTIMASFPVYAIAEKVPGVLAEGYTNA